MITRRISLSLATLVGVGLALGTSAGAQVIVQTFTIPPATVPFTDTFTFNTFDSSLGLLGAVQIKLDTSITAEVDIFNSTATNQPFSNAEATIPITLTAPGPTTISVNSTAGPFSGTATPGLNSFPGLTNNTTNTTNVASANFSLYEIPPSSATGTITVSSGAGNYSGTAGTGMFFGGSATAGGTITLTYFYQTAGSIPEPGTTTFLAAGVLGSLGMVIRRRKKK